MTYIGELMTVMSALIPLIIARVFHTIAVMPVIAALTTVIIALMSLSSDVMSVTTAPMNDITGAVPVPIRVMWRTTPITCPISGILWLSKNELRLSLESRDA